MSRTLINGTGYDVSGGRTLIGGTGYGISGGKTLIGGTGYSIDFKRLPVKGERITLNLDGKRTYRVLTINGNIAEVLGIFVIPTGTQNNVIAFNDGNGKYANSNVDTLLTSWYNRLSTSAKNAITQSAITIYQMDNTNSPSSTYASMAKPWSETVTTQESLSRYVYALGVRDVDNYFDQKFSTADLINFYGYGPMWLRDAYFDTNYQFVFPNASTSYIASFKYNKSYSIAPCFKIDLSKISYTIFG